MKPERKKPNMVKIYNFTRVADQDIIIDIHESRMIPRKVKFEDFIIEYQERHKEKFGRLLKF